MLRIESKPPWESGSTFYDLEISLTQFVETLPEYLLFTIDHLSAHIASGSPTPYVLMHTVYFLCLIVLHREYVPYIPWKCSKPEGPVDEPTFPPAKYKIPKGWWEKSATKLFGAARSILNLVQECRAHDVLVESFLVCFAVFLVAFVGVYCDNFPYMDTMGVMCCKKSTTSSATDGDHRSEPADIALDIISHMRPRLKVAAEWCKTIINERYDYPSKIKRYKEENRGGGLDDWLKQGRYNAPSCLGINREEMDRPASGRSSVSMHDTSVSDAESVTVSGEAMDGVIRRTSCGTSRGTNSIPINPTGKNARAFDVSGPMGSNQGEMPIQLEFPTASQGVQNSLSYPLQDQQQFADSSRFAVQSCRTPPSSFSTTPMPMFGSPNLYSIPSWGFDEYCPEDTPGFWDALGVIAVQDPQQHFMTGY